MFAYVLSRASRLQYVLNRNLAYCVKIDVSVMVKVNSAIAEETLRCGCLFACYHDNVTVKQRDSPNHKSNGRAMGENWVKSY